MQSYYTKLRKGVTKLREELCVPSWILCATLWYNKTESN
jgi:hypothetical protein